MNGFVVLDKPEGLTSFKAAACLRRIYSEKKIGHTGTLDPMAVGVLPVALGRATRFIDFLPDAEKEYVARLRFGMTTDTLDITGTVTSRTQAHVSEQDVRALLPSFTGTITQIPPMYSAVSVGGRRLYELARQGLEVERQARQISIFALDFLSEPSPGEFEIRVRCSKGTYVRTLIDDMGKTLGVGAVMTALRRTASNGFFMKDAKTPETVEADPDGALLPVDHPFLTFPGITVSEKQAVRFLNGGSLALDRLRGDVQTGVNRVYAPDGTFLGLGESVPEQAAFYARRVIHE